MSVINVVKLATFDPVLRGVTEIGGRSRGLTAGPRLNCSSRGLVSLGVLFSSQAIRDQTKVTAVTGQDTDDEHNIQEEQPVANPAPLAQTC
ncbi:hypothetical protein ElyMa_001859300 [Elysia marginata]|uniref:Uncharacterized protein n=1 Tax=Elysia marginata TaxID=1093978 RepID=A0AAV4END2_9GAST|nr:hypothetical protein ElyMa_001859300 [Elysia marginata]